MLSGNWKYNAELPDEFYDPERALYCALILRTIRDVLIDLNKPRKNPDTIINRHRFKCAGNIHNSAIEFINSPEFDEIAERANFSAENIRKVLPRLMITKNGTVLRDGQQVASLYEFK